LNIEPKVSILLPIYNYQNIEPTINSLLDQTFTNFELLICDDGSKPKIVMPSYDDKRIKIFRNHRNRGLGETLNRLFYTISDSSEYFSTVEQDDIYKPYYLDECVEYLDNNPNCGLVSGISEFVVGDKVTYRFPGMLDSGKDYPVGKEMFLLNYRRQIKVTQTCMVVRKKVHLKNNLKFSIDYPSVSVDWDYILRFSLISRIKGLKRNFVIQDRSIDRQSLTTKTELVYKTSRKLLINFYKEFPNIIKMKDYKYALSTQLYLELGSKKFFFRILSLFGNIIFIEPDKKRFLRNVIKEISRVRNYLKVSLR